VILRHRAENWSEISAPDLIATLNSLKDLVLAPNSDAPF